MNQSIINELKKEGYKKIYLWKDPPNKRYNEHFHLTETKIIITKGEMLVKIEGKTKKFKEGDLLLIPKRAKHSASVGKDGCEYMVGEK